MPSLEPELLLHLKTLVMWQNDWPPKYMAYWLVRTGHNSTDVIINARDKGEAFGTIRQKWTAAWGPVDIGAHRRTSAQGTDFISWFLPKPAESEHTARPVLPKAPLVLAKALKPRLVVIFKLEGYLRSSDQEIDCADIGISAPSAKLI